MVLRLLLMSLLLGEPLVSDAGEFVIKELSLGSPMNSCPSGTATVHKDGPATLCFLPPLTVANQPMSSHYVRFYRGMLVSYGFSFEPNLETTQALKAALVAKFGYPDADNPITGTLWASKKSAEFIYLNGRTGSLAISNEATDRQIKAESGSRNKADL